MTYRNGSSLDGRHYWITPPELRQEIYEKYGCTFDPCPYPRPADFDGLAAPWDRVNFVNPPFDRLREWCRKAIAEQDAGRSSVLLVPVKEWEMVLFSRAAQILPLGRVRWLAIEDGSPQRAGKGWPILAVVLQGNKTHTLERGIDEGAHHQSGGAGGVNLRPQDLPRGNHCPDRERGGSSLPMPQVPDPAAGGTFLDGAGGGAAGGGLPI